MTNSKYKYLNLIVCVILIIVCKYVLHPYLATFKEDDIYCITTDVWPDHGEYLTSFCSNFIVWWLPEMLHIHPQNFVDPFGVLVRCILLVGGCYLMASFVYMNNLKKTFMPFFIILSFYLTLVSFNYEYRAFYLYAGFFRFHFPLILSMAFWLLIYKNVINEQKKVDKSTVFEVIISFLAGWSSEFISLFSMIPLGFLGLAKLIKEKRKFFDKNTILSIAFIIGGLLVIGQSYFMQYANSYCTNPPIPLGTFLSEYWDLVIIRHLFPIYNIIILIFLLKMTNKLNSRILIPAVSFAISPYIVMGMFFFAGVYQWDFSHSWLYHGHFHQVMDNFLFCIQFFLFGNVLTGLETCDKKKSCLLMMIFIIVFQILYSFNSFKAYCTDGINHHKYNDKMNTYITDKMFLFYILNDKPIVLGNKFVHNVVGVVDPDVYSEDIKETEVEHSRWFEYIRYIYPKVVDVSKYDKSKKIYFKPEDIAMEEFIKAGGNFEDGEIEKSDFNRLYDKDFVLNKK